MRRSRHRGTPSAARARRCGDGWVLDRRARHVCTSQFRKALAGAIALADIIRPESREALARLKAMGIRVMMLTGDATAVARWVARDVALDEFFAEGLPEQRARPKSRRSRHAGSRWP